MFLHLIFFGALIGIANILPGMSGGTMAVILNIYDRLIDTISNWRSDLMGSIRFLLPIAIGAGLAILLTSQGISYLLETQYAKVNIFFIGIIVGSLPMIFKEAVKDKFSAVNIVATVWAFWCMVMMARFSDIENSAVVITTLSTGVFFNLLFCSAIAAVCMIIPGISGSFIMLLLGMYGTIVTAIKDLNILLLMPIGLGILLGILGGAKVIHSLLKQYKSVMYSAILGLVVGSIYTMCGQILKSGELTISFGAIVAYIVVFAIGCGMTLVFDSPKLKEYFNKK
ncbi:MAG: DUF368 domain-containing protein [Bacillota bacterium]